MNKRTLYAASVALGLFLSLSAPTQAQQIYQCKDANGRTLTSDRPIPECANRSSKVLGKDGTVRKELPPPLTAEQKAAQEEEEKKKKAELAAKAEQRKRDLLLLSTYRSEKEIEAARDRVLTQIQTEVSEAKASAEAAAVKRKAAQADIDKIKKVKADAKIPRDLQSRFDEANNTEQSESKRAAKLESDQLKQKQTFDAFLTRFRELSKPQDENQPKR